VNMTMKKSRSQPPKIRGAVQTDARRIHALIQQHMEEGRLLPRELNELHAHVDRFVVAVDGRGAIVGCAELAPLSHSLAEIRSLVVTRTRRSAGVGRRIVNELRQRARHDGYDDLCVFAHQPGYFAHMGFSIVPHTWLPEKISANCRTCVLFRRCGQFAMVSDLDGVQNNAALEQPIHV
jgi:N-acetylglutamate synthase-like GNAT family acetyltransferase